MSSKEGQTPASGARQPQAAPAPAGGAKALRANALGSTANSSPELLPTETWLGGLFLRLLPGWLYFAPSLIMPAVTAAAAVGAIWGPTMLAVAASLPLVHAVPLASPLLAALGTQQPWAGLASVALSLLSVYYAFGVMPLLDCLLGRDLRNPTPEEAKSAAGNGLYRGILYAYVPVHWAVLVGACHLACRCASPAAAAGLAVSVGVANGILFTVAHELLHGGGRADRLLAGALLAAVGYQHWTRSHLIHHARVATPEDPSSARRGEALWAFFPRSVWGNLRDGYAGEAARRRRMHIPFWSARNR
jgi:alkane 1-monooxygenase